MFDLDITLPRPATTTTGHDTVRSGSDDHLEMLTLAEEHSPVPLLLCHQVFSQPYFRQADKVGQSVKLGHLSDSVRAEMQELQASEVG